MSHPVQLQYRLAGNVLPLLTHCNTEATIKQSQSKGIRWPTAGRYCSAWQLMGFGSVPCTAQVL